MTRRPLIVTPMLFVCHQLLAQQISLVKTTLPAWPVKMNVTIKIPKDNGMEVKKIKSAKETFHF